MTNDPPSVMPTLDAPGAGLPIWERLLIRYVALPMYLRNNDWDRRARLFAREGEKIVALLGQPGIDLERRVLVKRLAGLEDSSRYWSVAMAVEHLMILGREFTRFIGELSHHRAVTSDVTVASVKPKPKSAAGLVEQFEKVLADFNAAANDPTADRRASGTLPHPWFGPLTAARWLAIAALHQQLHRQQMKLIVAGSRSPTS